MLSVAGTKTAQTPIEEGMQALYIPPMSADEEDALIHTRITNDERPLRRVTRKFHIYFNTAYSHITSPVPGPSATPGGQGDDVASAATGSVDEARESFLVELASFDLLLKKSKMVCDAEKRQVEEYRRESARISQERETLREEIEQLKVGLEQAQMERRRKIEYDQVAERINTLPTREELDLSIEALENDLQAIRTDHETQDRMIQTRKVALDTIVSDLGQLRLLGGENDEPSAAPSPGPDGDAEMSAVDGGDASDTQDGGRREAGPNATELEAGMKLGQGSSGIGTLNPNVKPFQPRAVSLVSGTSLLHAALRNSASRAPTPMSSPSFGASHSLPNLSSKSKGSRGRTGEDDEEEEGEDIEMGEVSEKEEVRGRRSREEDREEGEASDEGSDLSEHPNG